VEVARQIDTGAVNINSPFPPGSNAMPLGGVKDSGFGREMGYEGVWEFCTEKSITLPKGAHARYGATTDDIIIAN